MGWWLLDNCLTPCLSARYHLIYHVYHSIANMCSPCVSRYAAFSVLARVSLQLDDGKAPGTRKANRRPRLSVTPQEFAGPFTTSSLTPAAPQPRDNTATAAHLVNHPPSAQHQAATPVPRPQRTPSYPPSRRRRRRLSTLRTATTPWRATGEAFHHSPIARLFLPASLGGQRLIETSFCSSLVGAAAGIGLWGEGARRGR